MTSRQNDSHGNSLSDNAKETSHSKTSGKRIFLIAISVIAALAILVTSVFFIMSAIGKSRLHSDDNNISVPADVSVNVDDGGIVEYEGQKYKYNKNIASVLFLGIDKGDIGYNEGYGKNGQADSIFVACMDTSTGAVKIIPISRETAVDVNLYSVSGEYSGVRNEQVCLAYSYGDDPESSCKNVLTSVSRILYGITPASYVAIDLNGVSTLTDMIGGVTLTSLETVGEFTEGKSVTLKGKNAVSYIRARGSDLEANNRRMQRQKQFLGAFASKAGNEILSNFTKLGTYYGKAKPYITTDLGLTEVVYLANCCLTTNVGSSIQYINIEGTSTLVDGHVLFTPDSNSLYKAVLDAFYTPVK